MFFNLDERKYYHRNVFNGLWKEKTENRISKIIGIKKNIKNLKMKSWLIQRGRFKGQDTRLTNDIVNIDSLIRFDYMGSAEFEWGALPKSINRITKDWDNYRVVGTGIKDKKKRELFTICNKNRVEDTLACIDHVSKTPYGYKEWCDMGWSLSTIENIFSQPSSGYNDFWWDIENDWMACVGIDRINQVKYAVELTVNEKEGVTNK
ncbi:hypothetical protein EBB07_29125 [Paenibacillaceae bacterium]|nr:hypothetical protein EBB07_29125 [Paenibacillaceae bacterium]